MRNPIRRFLADESGNFAMTFGLTIFPILFLAGMAMDYSAIQRERWRLQETADASALYAVQELRNVGTTEADLSRTGQDVVDANFMLDGELKFALDTQANLLSVSLAKNYQPGFLSVLDSSPIPLKVVAQVKYEEKNEQPRCFWSLSETESGVVNVTGNAIINAANCGFQVNSSSSTAVNLTGSNTSITASWACIAGGVNGGASRIIPAPNLGCKAAPDPFASLQQPTVGPCTRNNFRASGTTTISPGVYCGGIDVASGANVTFRPGLYIIRDGALRSSGTTTMTGDGVTFYFVGTGSVLDLSSGTTFNFKAMSTGSLAGFVVYFAPTADTRLTNAFSGNGATYYEGILYFGRRAVSVGGNGNVNGTSSFSVVIAETISLNGNATINFKVDPSNTTLAVPSGLYTKTISAYLVK